MPKLITNEAIDAYTVSKLVSLFRKENVHVYRFLEIRDHLPKMNNDKVVVEIEFNADLKDWLDIRQALLDIRQALLAEGTQGLSYTITGLKGISDTTHVFEGQNVYAYGPFTNNGQPLQGVAHFDKNVGKYCVELGNGANGWYHAHELQLQ